MRCEESFITIKHIWHSYLVLSLGNYAYETPTETGLNRAADTTCMRRDRCGILGPMPREFASPRVSSGSLFRCLPELIKRGFQCEVSPTLYA